jgi:hypothetical protein
MAKAVLHNSGKYSEHRAKLVAFIARVAAPISEDAGEARHEAHSCASQAADPSNPTAACARYCGNMETCISSKYNREKVLAQHDAVRAEERSARASPSGSTEQPAAASVSSDEFHAVWAGDDYRAGIAYIDAWGAQQREAGRNAWHATGTAVIEQWRARAEAAEKERDAERDRLDKSLALSSQIMKERDDLRAQLADYEECAASHSALVRQIDVMMNGEDGAAKQASLCDLIGQLGTKLARPADLAGQEPKHPMQPVVLDKVGTLRFKENAIVRFLAQDRLCELAGMEFSDADREQLVQLIGYSVSGTSNFDFVSNDTYNAAQAAGEALLAGGA